MRSKALMLIDFTQRFRHVEDVSTILSVKSLFLESAKIEKAIKWWAINSGVTSPCSINGCYSYLRAIGEHFLEQETDPQDRIKLFVCFNSLHKEEDRWSRLAARVTRENSRESVRKVEGRYLQVEEMQKLTRACHDKGTALVKRIVSVEARQKQKKTATERHRLSMTCFLLWTSVKSINSLYG